MTSFTPVQIDFSLVANAMNARINQSLVGQSFNATGSQLATTSANAQAELDSAGIPPWRQEEQDLRTIALSALGSGSLISASTSRKALAADEDTPKIFAAYDALAKLQSLAAAIADGTVSDAYADRAKERIVDGIKEVQDFLSESDLEAVTMLSGERLSKAVSETAIKRSAYEITTDVLHTGEKTDAVAQWAGLSGFNMTIDRPDGQINVNIDLTSLADADRSMENVVDLINTELESAGAITRFSATKVGEKDDNGYVKGNDWALKLTSTSTETISFSTTTDGPSLYMVGASGEKEYQYAQLSKWTGLSDAAPTRSSAQNYEANIVKTEIDVENDAGEPETKTIETPSPTRFLSTATGTDGSVYALVETEGDLGEQLLRGESDLALVKYDSTGREIWTRMVGATEDVTGAALAVSDGGRIAIGGTTSGELASDAIGSGKSGFVIMYDSSGVEVMTRQQGSGFDDSVTSLAFDADGSLYIGGKTKGTLDDSAILGGADAYVEKLDTSGERVWINQFGTTGEDSVTALAADGAGGVVAATYEDGQAMMRSMSDATFTGTDFSYTLGDATITSLAYDAGALYAAGETRLDGYTAGQITGTSKSDIDAFAMRLDVSGATASAAWYQSFDGADDQSASSILVDNGSIYLAGTGAGTFGATASTGDKNAFLVSMNAADGVQNWATTMDGRGGLSSASGLALSTSGDNDLDAFGLPTGKLQLGDVSYISDRTSARVGDHFYMSVDGGKQKKITLEAGDTYRSMTFKLNAALLLDGQATARRGTEGQTLRIEPAENVQIKLTAGADGQDLLSAIGLPEGIVYNAPSLLDDDESSSDAPPLIALGLTPNEVTLGSEEEAQSVADMLDAALRGLRKAYRYAIEDPTLTQLSDNANGQNSGAVSAYQSAQLANLQAGLARLQAGGGGGGAAALFA